MIIELERYNGIGELLIEIRTTGSQGHICYRDGGRRVSVAMAAVCMGVKEMGMQTWHRGAYNWPLIGNESRSVHNHCGAIKEALTCNKMEIDWKERGLGPSGPRSAS